MPALQVRDFPEELYNQLRSCAAEQDRSISQQTTYVLRLEASFEGAPGPDSLPSSVDMIREMREERDEHLLSLLRNGQED